MTLRILRFGEVVADEVVERRNAGRIRMSPGDALNRGKPSEGKKVAEGIHADIGIEEEVEFAGGDLPPRGLQVVGQRQDARSEDNTSELQSLMRRSYDEFCLNKKSTSHM